MNEHAHENEQQTNAGGTAQEADKGITSPRTAGRVKWISLAAVIISFLVLLRALPVGAASEAMLAWVEGLGALAPVVFVGLYLLVTVLMLPASPLSIAAGILFGLVYGVLLVLIGATLGMAAAFLIGRYAAREWVEKKARRFPKFAAIDQAVGEGGWKIVALLRLSPAVPFNLQNYLYGLTAIRFWPCILASAVAIIPGTFMYVYLGYVGRATLAAAGTEEAGRGLGQWALLIIGLAATIAVTVYITRLAQKKLRAQKEMDATIPEEQAAPEETAQTAGRAWLGAGVAALIAVLLVPTAISAHIFSDKLRSIFGPPGVVMQEVYEVQEDAPTFNHEPFRTVLEQYVNAAGGVDYAGLKANPDTLLAYNASLADAPFDEMGRNEKLALLINAYNSFTLELIIEWLDEGIDSIRDIPAEKRWDDVRWQVGGNTWSLNQIEHQEIRPKFIEPDIHWVLVCAAVGCPPLRREPYTSDQVDEQLRDQARIIHADGSRWFQLDRAAGVVHLTPLYNWYGGDFEQVAESVLHYAAMYAENLAQALEAGDEPRITWLNYDWALNNQENLH